MLPANNLPVPPTGATPAPEGGSPEINPAELESMLTEVLGRVKQIADQNGLDFNALIASISGGAPAETGMAAPPMSPPMGAPPAPMM